jgi:aconitate hydratase
VFTDPRTLGKAPEIALPEVMKINDNLIEMPASPEEAASVDVERGPNIKPIPKGVRPAADLACKTALKVGDNITTDHIMPAGTKILPYRSNVPKLSEFCFTVCDKEFPERAKAKNGGIIVGGTNYGQGSSREHAALVPLYLGIKAVVAKSFARIHVANLINFGIVPLTFANPEDYDRIDEGDALEIAGFAGGVAGAETLILKDTTKGIEIPLVLTATERQRAILGAGGLLNYTRANG